MKRIFLELDVIDDGLNDCIPLPCTIINDCSSNLKNTWQEILQADEIYFHSALYANGSSVFSSVQMLDLLMEKAIKEGVNGKKVFCCYPSPNLHRLNADLFSKCFCKSNSFFVRVNNKWRKIKHI